MHRARKDPTRPVRLQRIRRLDDGAGGIDDVVLQDARPAADVTDHVHHFRSPVIRAPLVDNRQVGAQPLRVCPCPLCAAGIRRHDGQIRNVEPGAVIDDHRCGKQVIHRDVEEPLDLRLVQIHRQHAVGPGGAQQVRHELGRDRHPRLVLPVLPRVAVIRHHSGDA